MTHLRTYIMRDEAGAEARSAISLARVLTTVVVAITSLGIVACGSTKSAPSSTTNPSSTTSAASGSPETLARALLTPADIDSPGFGLPTLTQFVQTSSNYTLPGAGTTGAQIRFVSGDPGCRSVLGLHPQQSDAWAQVIMHAPNKTTPVTEDIEAFKDVATAQRIERENREQLANCHTFIGVNEPDKITGTFTHSALSVPPMGDEMVAHRLYGTAANMYIVYDEVEIRSGADVIFVSVSGASRGTAETSKVASAALKKYSRTV